MSLEWYSIVGRRRGRVVWDLSSREAAEDAARIVSAGDDDAYSIVKQDGPIDLGLSS